MGKLLLALCFAISASVRAEQLELDLENPNSEKELAQILDLIENDDSYDLFDVGNGEYYITEFDLTTFEIANEVEKLQADYPNDGDMYGDCIFEDTEPTKSIDVVKMAESHSYNSQSLDLIERLEKTGMVEVLLGRVWDGISGDSEYCLLESYRVYLKNGKVLHLNYDHTD